MRRILWLTRDDTAKVLVFSTWVDVLNLMAHALNCNGVPYAYATGSKKFTSELQRFRSAGPDTAVDTSGCG